MFNLPGGVYIRDNEGFRQQGEEGHPSSLYRQGSVFTDSRLLVKRMTMIRKLCGQGPDLGEYFSFFFAFRENTKQRSSQILSYQPWIS